MRIASERKEREINDIVGLTKGIGVQGPDRFSAGIVVTTVSNIRLLAGIPIVV